MKNIAQNTELNSTLRIIKSKLSHRSKIFDADPFMKPFLQIIENRDISKFFVLDLGCSHYCRDLNLFKNLGVCSCIGIDRERLNPLFRPKDISVIRADFSDSNIPFIDEIFDLIILNDTIEHLYDPMKALKESKRILKNNGFIIIITPNHANLKNRIKLLLGESVYTPLENWLISGRKEIGNKICFKGHIREYTANEIKKMMTLIGLKIEAIDFFPATTKSETYTFFDNANDICQSISDNRIERFSKSRILFFMYGLIEKFFPNLRYRISIIARKI